MIAPPQVSTFSALIISHICILCKIIGIYQSKNDSHHKKFFKILTPYRNFEEPTDILRWKCDRQFSEAMRGYEKSGSRERNGLLEYMFGYWQEHSQVLEILLVIKRRDIIHDCFIRNARPMMAQLRRRIDIPEEQEEYFMAIRISVLVGVLQVWIQNGKKESARQLSEMLDGQIRQIVRSDMIL